ncbi:hypothetical protein B0J13DRAFT_630118 [Dactylonectria estremocensis]|uniref:Uncharacterized protein n=1 Tax=Dactylonectria estremocensis TaxID=1079267 RepID=A0A9P9DDU6_9HYPO|nr:hypothetical protein B0J13DRAFT_630118 [Dactylonectria estremocensis]
MKAIGHSFGFDGTERRLRCAPHCFNRVVRAMLYGNETKSLANALDDTPKIYDADRDEDTLDDALDDTLKIYGADRDEDTLDDALDEDQEGTFGVDESDNEYADAGIVVDNLLELPEFTYPIPEVISKDALARFRKKGPIGKLHNIGVAIRKSPRLRNMYLQAQVG